MAEEKPRTKSSQPKEASPAFMSSIFAVFDVYLNKILVGLMLVPLFMYRSVKALSHC